jgi:hypothetical protein
MATSNVQSSRRRMIRVRFATNRNRTADDRLFGSASLQSAGHFCAFFSGPEIPFPGNGDRETRLSSRAADYLPSRSVGAKLEQNLSAAIRFQRLLERFLELLERVDMLNCGGERSISYEVA